MNIAPAPPKMKNVQTIIEEHGGLDSLLKHGLVVAIKSGDCLKITVGASQWSRDAGYYWVDVSHPTNELDEDAELKCRPEMHFRVKPAQAGPWEWYPMVYHDDFRDIHQIAAEPTGEGPGGLTVIDAKLVEELRHVADMWDILLGAQEFVEAWRRLKAAVDMAQDPDS